MPDPRSQFYGLVLGNDGEVVTTATATVYLAPPFAAAPLQTFATIFNTETGTGTPGNPITLSNGQIDFWAPTGSYDVLIQDQSSPKKFDDRVIRFDSIPANAGIGPAQIAANSVDASKVLDGSLTLADLAAVVSESLSIRGEIKMWPSATAPTGYLFCNGAAVARSTYQSLFDLIGTTFGAGNGTTTFNLPDFAGRVPVGAGASSNAVPNVTITNRGVGARFGIEKVALVVAELASHAHTINDPGHAHSISDPGHGHSASTDSQGNHAHTVGGGVPIYNTNHGASGSIGLAAGSHYTIHRQRLDADATGAHGHNVSIGGSGTGIGINSAGTGVTVQNSGSGTAHENQQPGTAINFIIKYT